jgi:hypothetical protein
MKMLLSDGNELLLEFAEAEGNLVGVLLQELAVAATRPKITSDTGTVCRFEATLQDVSPNRNRRMYTEDVLASALASPQIKEKLRTRTMFGEANHPFLKDVERQMVVDHTRISHLVTAISPLKNGIVRGHVETAATAVGRDYRGLIVENGSMAAFSMRGIGGVRRVPGKDLVEVTKPLALISYDSVTYPSHQNAYMDTLNETHVAPVTVDQATAYACDQSGNFQALMEQFELIPDELRLTADNRAMVVRSGQTVIAAFLEKDIRTEFRTALRGKV